MKDTSLTVVGLGIKFLSHLTTEARVNIEQASKVLYLVNNPAMKEWIHTQNTNAESLENFYAQYPKRSTCYKAIAEYILKNLGEGQHICVVLYGHPAVFAQPALDAVQQARKRGYPAKLLPAISAEDCLFADLLIDPGVYGCQSYEATDFLIHQYSINTSSHFILWQIDVIGILDHSKNRVNRYGLLLLEEYLTLLYSKDHEVTLYEAAQYPRFTPRITYLSLNHLHMAEISPVTSLYIPPKGKPTYNNISLTQLGISLENLEN